MSATLLRRAAILPMNDTLDVVEGDLLVRDGRITAVGPASQGHALPRHDGAAVRAEAEEAATRVARRAGPR